MATVYNETTGADFLKVQYPDGPEVFAIEDQKFLLWCEHKDDFEGSGVQLNPLFGDINGSANFATAMANASVPTSDVFSITASTLAQYYVLGNISNKAIKIAKSKKGAVAELLKTQLDAGLREFGRHQQRTIWGNHGGALGRVATSGITTTSLTLATTADAVKFKVGMEVVLSSADGTSGSVRAGSATITGINRSTGVLTTDSNWTTQITGATDADYIFVEDTFGACAYGVQSWCPLTAPAATAFFGVDRTQDIDALSGLRRTTDANKDLETNIFNSLAHGDNLGGKFTHAWIHGNNWARLVNSLHAKTYYERQQEKGSVGTFGFESFKLYSTQGDIAIVTDRDMPTGYIYFGRKGNHIIHSADPAPHFEMQSGDKLLVSNNSDGKGFRIKGYWHHYVKRPLDCMWSTL